MRHEALAAQLAEAHHEVEAAMDARRQFLVAGDVSDVAARKAVDARVVAAQSAELGLGDALELVARNIADLERKIAAERDKAEREAAAAEIIAAVDPLSVVIADMDKAHAAALAATEPVVAHLPGSNPNFTSNLTALLKDASTAMHNLASEAHAHAAAIEAGNTPIIEVARDPVERRLLYTLQDSMWHEANGEIRTAPQYSQVSVPEAIAVVAIKNNLAADFHTERVARLIECFGINYGPALPDLALI
jgi:hypothetical protein